MDQDLGSIRCALDNWLNLMSNNLVFRAGIILPSLANVADAYLSKSLQSNKVKDDPAANQIISASVKFDIRGIGFDLEDLRTRSEHL